MVVFLWLLHKIIMFVLYQLYEYYGFVFQLNNKIFLFVFEFGTDFDKYFFGQKFCVYLKTSYICTAKPKKKCGNSSVGRA